LLSAADYAFEDWPIQIASFGWKLEHIPEKLLASLVNRKK